MVRPTIVSKCRVQRLEEGLQVSMARPCRQYDSISGSHTVHVCTHTYMGG